jgi:hypothetical protein
MKKTIIKRRKRVVPALREHSPAAATHSSTGSSVSPETSPRALGSLIDESPRNSDNETTKILHANPTFQQQQQQQQEEEERPYAPIPPPVDFTGYHSAPLKLPHHPYSRAFEPESHINRQSSSPHLAPSGMVIQSLFCARFVSQLLFYKTFSDRICPLSVKSTSSYHFQPKFNTSNPSQLNHVDS